MEAEAAAWRQEAQTTQAVCSDPKIYAMQLAMLQPEVPSSLLGAAAASFQRSWYESVVLERVVNKLCGWPCCATYLKKPTLKQRLKAKQTGDDIDTYCSSACRQTSLRFAAALPMYRRLPTAPAAPSPPVNDGPAKPHRRPKIRKRGGGGGGGGDEGGSKGEGEGATTTPAAPQGKAGASAPLPPPTGDHGPLAGGVLTGGSGGSGGVIKGGGGIIKSGGVTAGAADGADNDVDSLLERTMAKLNVAGAGGGGSGGDSTFSVLKDGPASVLPPPPSASPVTPATPDLDLATTASTPAAAPPAWAAGVASSRPKEPTATKGKKSKEGKEGNLVVKKGGETKAKSKAKGKKGEKDAPPAEAVRSMVVERSGVSALAGPPSMALPGTGGSAPGSGHGMAIDGYTPRFSVKDTADRRRKRSAAADAAKGSKDESKHKGKDKGKGEGNGESSTVGGGSGSAGGGNSSSAGTEAPPAMGEGVVAVGKASRRSPLDAAADTGPDAITSTRAAGESRAGGAPVLHPALSDEDIIERCKDGPSGESIVADLEFR